MRKGKEELEDMRERFLAKTSLTEEVLRERGENYQLYPEDRVVYDAILGIDYLLGKD